MHALVVAKAPVAGLAKTRLGALVGDVVAARLAAAALLDTLDACEQAVGAARVHVAMAGDLDAAEQSQELRRRLASYDVFEQCAGGFDVRLAQAHGTVATRAPGAAVVQVGMDTPQLDADLLTGAAEDLADHDAVLGPAVDGGWWVLALRDPATAAALVGVPMSTDGTCDHTRQALVAAGLRVGQTAVLRDVDEVDDARAVAALAADSRFAHAWRALAATRTQAGAR